MANWRQGSPGKDLELGYIDCILVVRTERQESNGHHHPQGCIVNCQTSLGTSPDWRFVKDTRVDVLFPLFIATCFRPNLPHYLSGIPWGTGYPMADICGTTALVNHMISSVTNALRIAFRDLSGSMTSALTPSTDFSVLM